jgi:type IV secretion system protein VirD4
VFCFGRAAGSGGAGAAAPGAGDLVSVAGDAHAITLAASGAGKFLNTVGPNVLNWPGPLIVVDGKGEIAQVCARARREIGPVHVLDPFGLVTPTSDSFNPMDLLTLPSPFGAAQDAVMDDEAEALAGELSSGHGSARDPFWCDSACGLISGAIGYAARKKDAAERNLNSVVDLLFNDDVVYNIATKLDAKEITGMAYQRCAAFLQIPDGGSGSTRSCVLTSAHQFITCLQAQRVRECVAKSSFSLAELREGRTPMTIFIVFPPHKLAGHRGLLRLWLRSLTNALATRTAMPPLSTLLMIDEAAQFALDDLPAAHAYLRGFGVQIWSMWQSLSQIASRYPKDHKEIIENCRLIQAYGLHATAVRDVADLLHVSPQVLRSLGTREQVAAVADQEPRVISRIDYRTDPLFRGRFDPNPRYANRSGTRGSGGAAA